MHTPPNNNHKALQVWRLGSIKVIECDSCGYIHLYPFPTVEELTEYYENLYHREKFKFPYDDITPSFISRLKEETERNPSFHKINKQIEALLDEQPDKTMLDIGAGNSLLSSFLSRKGWQSTLIEPNVDAAKFQANFDAEVINDFINVNTLSNIPKQTFINLQFVLEHILDPIEFLSEILNKMHEQSIIRIQVPNDFSPGQLAWMHKNNTSPEWVSYPDHINYFNFESLTRLLTKLGLKIVHRDTTFPLELFLLTGTDYYQDKQAATSIGDRINMFEQSWRESEQEATLDDFYHNLAMQNMGRSVIVYAMKA